MREIKFDKEMVESILTDKGGMLKKTAVLLNIPYPLQKGWKEDLIGTLINEDDYYKLCEGKAPKKMQQVFSFPFLSLNDLNEFIKVQNITNDMVINIISENETKVLYYWY